MTTRRTFLRTGSLAALAAASRSSGLYTLGSLQTGSRNAHVPPGELPHATDPDLKALAMRALDAAKSKGASYADVRFTVTKRRAFIPGDSLDTEIVAMGVRALAGGAWGFASHAELTPDVAARLGSKATEAAKVSAWPDIPHIELTDRPTTTVGHWETPVKRDPFKVPLEEVMSLCDSASQAVAEQGATGILNVTFERQDRIFASTDGAYLTQTIYTALGGSPHSDVLPSLFRVTFANSDDYIYMVPVITPTGGGYEVLEDLKLLDHIPEYVSVAKDMFAGKDFDQFGEYDVVFDGYAMAAIVDGTFGRALEYDRAVGYDQDSEGVSYLTPPSKVLGTPYASSAVTITADRTMPGGAATVQWDDEGVTPHATTLVKDGVVVDYATSREFVSELAPWYRKRSETVRSNGCAASESALSLPLVCTPNIALQAGAQDVSFADLVSKIDNGIAVMGGPVHMDYQQISGRGGGAGTVVYEIKHGKLGSVLLKSRYLFRTQDLWKNLVTLGGAKSAKTRGLSTSKGAPNQLTLHSVKAVAAQFKKVQVGTADDS